MIPGIIGKKIGMSQVFSDGGIAEAVTVIEAGPCIVTQVKTSAKEGYDAVQLGFGTAKRLNKAEQGHLKELGKFEQLREFRVDDSAAVKVGDKVDVSQFQAGDFINVIGISKGKGFAGVVKRHGFHGGPKTHGQTDRHRAPGAIGATTSPGRVLKGLRMAGHMGSEQVTVKGLKVYKTDPEHNLLMVIGAVPGNKNGLLLISKANKRK
ncbi:MAG: 50S ribosomal protein L3 [Dehalococcoidales bacterium]|nr:50S ribosomal protein L3 [Dehalococcoidales bacterium]